MNRAAIVILVIASLLAWACSQQRPVSSHPVAGGEIVTSGMHTCVVVADGSARCWGHDEVGQLGDGDARERDVPTPVHGLVGAGLIATGARHTCATVKGGRRAVLGIATGGQLGNGTTDAVVRATRVVWR